MIKLNDVPINITLFPDNTSQVWKISNLNPENYAMITWDFKHEGELVQIAQLRWLLAKYKIKPMLDIIYLPYGRQDKEISNETTFGLLYFADWLNSLDFKEIMITDPHSDVALKLINNSRAYYPINRVKDIFVETNSDLVCYPDKGASSKYTDIYKLPSIRGEKVRDQLTGQITSYSLIGEPKDKNILIVDDICDYGRTFIILTKELINSGAKEVNLFVTHGLFSGGTRVLREAGIKRIFTSEKEIVSDRIIGV